MVNTTIFDTAALRRLVHIDRKLEANGTVSIFYDQTLRNSLLPTTSHHGIGATLLDT